MANQDRGTATAHARLLLDTLRIFPGNAATDLAGRWASADAAALVQLGTAEGAPLWLQRRLNALRIELPDPARTNLASASKRLIAQLSLVELELMNALAIIDETDVPAVPLKSAALRRLAARVPYVDARGSIDVDVLLPEAAAQRVWDAFFARQYQVPYRAPPDGHHLPVLQGPLGVSVEIHLSTIAPVTPAEAWKRMTCEAATADFAGRMRAIPSDTELFWHSMAHGLKDQDRETRLRQWLDAAAFLAAGADIDWDRITHRIQSEEAASLVRAHAWLGAAEILSGRPLPPSVMKQRVAPPLDLARLLSWRLRVHARHKSPSRWKTKLISEGGRGESRLQPSPSYPSDSAYIRVRHAAISRLARAWWIINR